MGTVRIGPAAMGSYAGNEQFDTRFGAQPAQSTVQTQDAYPALTRALGATLYVTGYTERWLTDPQTHHAFTVKRFYGQPWVRVLVDILDRVGENERREHPLRCAVIKRHNQWLRATDAERQSAAFSDVRPLFAGGPRDSSEMPGATRKEIGYFAAVKGAEVDDAIVAHAVRGEVIDEIQLAPGRGDQGEHLHYAGRGMQLDAANATTVVQPPASPRSMIREHRSA